MNKEKNLEGIKGWLILVAIAVVINPIAGIIAILMLYYQLFSSGTWEVLTTQGNETYNSLWASILSGELLIAFCWILVCLYIAYMFFSKSRNFPKWFIGAIIFSIVFTVVDAFAVNMVLPNEPIFDPATVKKLSRFVLEFFIWLPYMLVSKRVSETFKR